MGDAFGQWQQTGKHLSGTFREHSDGQRDSWNNSITFFRIYHSKERSLQDDPRVLFIGFEEKRQQFSVGLIIQINKVMVKYNFKEYPRENLQC